MKTYQTPEVLWQLVSDLDVIATSGVFRDEEGNDKENVMDWWG